MNKDVATGSGEIAAITALVDPWLWVNDRVTAPMAFRDAAVGPYGFEAIVRGIEAPDMPATAAGIRAALLARAEAALQALDDAGWQLSTEPHMTMEFETRVKPLTQTLAGVLVLPAEQSGIGLRMKFSVDRAR